MMKWFLSDWPTVVTIVLSTFGVFAAVVACIRLNGLRTLSKMSSFDFVVTIALGSLLAATAVTGSPSLIEGIVAIATLIVCQRIVARLRVRFDASPVVDNQPVVLMVGDTFDHDAMERVRVTESDLRAKLREANVIHLQQVLAVVFESTGDISVLHGNADDSLDHRLMQGVRGYDGHPPMPS